MSAKDFTKEKLILTKEDWLREMEAYATKRVTEALKEAADKIDELYKSLPLPSDNGMYTGLDYAETIVRDLIPKQEQKQNQ